MEVDALLTIGYFIILSFVTIAVCGGAVVVFVFDASFLGYVSLGFKVPP